MKKIFFSILWSIFITLLSIGIFSDTTFAAAVDLWSTNIQNIEELKGKTLQLTTGTTDSSPVVAINNAWKSILSTIKTILAGLMVIYIVYYYYSEVLEELLWFLIF